MPRRTASEALRTRDAIVARALDIASTDGLEGVTLGRLADDLQMSKAGVIGHFGTKEGLQLAVVAAARKLFLADVAGAAAGLRRGLERLLAFCDAWIAHIAAPRYPGGCFWAASSAEFDGRPGPVRDAIRAALEEFEEAIEGDVKQALADGDLPAGTDVDQVVFELRAIGLGLNQELQMHDNPAAERRARLAVRRAMGRPDLGLRRRRRQPAAA